MGKNTIGIAPLPPSSPTSPGLGRGHAFASTSFTSPRQRPSPSLPTHDVRTSMRPSLPFPRPHPPREEVTSSPPFHSPRKDNDRPRPHLSLSPTSSRRGYVLAPPHSPCNLNDDVHAPGPSVSVSLPAPPSPPRDVNATTTRISRRCAPLILSCHHHHATTTRIMMGRATGDAATARLSHQLLLFS